MPRSTALLFACAVFVLPARPGRGDEPAPPLVLFDFEDPAEVQAFSNLELPDPAPREPAVQIGQSTEHASRGKHSLKLTYAGGHWPTITTTRVPADWMKYQTFQADVTVSRPCVVGFTVLQEHSQRDQSWNGGISRWVQTEQLHAGQNVVTGLLHDSNDYAINAKGGPVVRFEIFMYQPHEGESIWVDHIRLSTTKQIEPPAATRFQVLGTDLEVSGVRELATKLRDDWKPPVPQTIGQLEAEFRALRRAEKNASRRRAGHAARRRAGLRPAPPRRRLCRLERRLLEQSWTGWVKPGTGPQPGQLREP